jgi:hypothetical protein
MPREQASQRHSQRHQRQHHQITVSSPSFSNVYSSYDNHSPPLRQTHSESASISKSSSSHRYLPPSQLSSIQSWASTVPARNSVQPHPQTHHASTNSKSIPPAYQPNHPLVLEYIAQKQRLLLQHSSQYSSVELQQQRANYDRLRERGRQTLPTPPTSPPYTNSTPRVPAPIANLEPQSGNEGGIKTRLRSQKSMEARSRSKNVVKAIAGPYNEELQYTTSSPRGAAKVRRTTKVRSH